MSQDRLGRAENRVVRDDEDLEVGVVHELVGVEVGWAGRGHRRIGAVEDVVRKNKDLEIQVIDNVVVGSDAVADAAQVVSSTGKTNQM